MSARQNTNELALRQQRKITEDAVKAEASKVENFKSKFRIKLNRSQSFFKSKSPLSPLEEEALKAVKDLKTYDDIISFTKDWANDDSTENQNNKTATMDSLTKIFGIKGRIEGDTDDALTHLMKLNEEHKKWSKNKKPIDDKTPKADAAFKEVKRRHGITTSEDEIKHEDKATESPRTESPRTESPRGVDEFNSDSTTFRSNIENAKKDNLKNDTDNSLS